MTPTLKPLVFLGSSQDDLRGFPPAVRHALGIELMRVQFGGEPTNCKPLPTVGGGAYQKKTQKTRKDDMILSLQRSATSRLEFANEQNRSSLER